MSRKPARQIPFATIPKPPGHAALGHLLSIIMHQQDFLWDLIITCVHTSKLT